MPEQPVVSFCIPVYNNAEAAEKLVKGILDSESTRFDVVVCDDASSDDCEERLTKIHDERFKYFRNAKNLGAHKNWEHTLELGSGEYLFIVMGRDRIKGEHIGRLIEILEYARKNNITLVEDGYGLDEEIQTYDGMDSMIRFLTYSHPTGNIFNAKLFREIPDRTRYFEIADMFPEDYLKRDMLLKGKGAAIMSGVFRFGDILIDQTKIQSTVENGKDLYDMFYAPGRRIKQTFEILDMVLSIEGRFTDEEFNRFLRTKYQSLLDFVAFGWWALCRSHEWQSHYGQKVRDISMSEIFRNIITAYRETLKHLRQTGTYTPSRHKLMRLCTLKAIPHNYAKIFSKKIFEPLGMWDFAKRVYYSVIGLVRHKP